MRGYCSSCREYRSDDRDAWGIIWHDGKPTCEKCGCYVNILVDEDEENKS